LAVYNRPVTPAAVDFVLAPHLPAMDSAPILQRLASMHFARKESGRFYLHPVDREFAFGLIPLTPAPLPLGEGEGVRAFTQHDLTLRAADYFAQARKPRAEWKKLDDLAAQLAEFDLRCAAVDYDTACSVLCEFDFDYLLLWGHYRLTIQMHEKVTGKINDPLLRMRNLNGLGLAYRNLGDARKSIVYFEPGIPAAQEAKNRQAEGAFLGNLGGTYRGLGEARKAIEFYEQALVIAREIGDRHNEGNHLGNLGNAYAALGEARQAIEFYEQALVIAREIGDRRGEGIALGNLGAAHHDMIDDVPKAIEYFGQALNIDREIGNRSGEETRLINLAEAYTTAGQYSQAIDFAKQSLSIVTELGIPATYEYGYLSQAYLFTEQLSEALSNVQEAQKFDEPINNYNISTLLGIIVLRQANVSAVQQAHQAFTRAIAQADEILAKTPDYYGVLDAKGLALCGLALCAEDGENYIAETVATFQKARKIAPHAGIVKRNLRLFDELAKCDENGLLKPVRAAVEGKE
jgi:tetratricopeptide (TPR) repeat protein